MMKTTVTIYSIANIVALGNKYLKKRCLELKKTEYEFTRLGLVQGLY